MNFRLVQKLVTLNDLERRNDRYVALFHWIWCKHPFQHNNRVDLWRNLCTNLTYFVVCVRCRHKKSSRSLSHLPMSFLLKIKAITSREQAQVKHNIATAAVALLYALPDTAQSSTVQFKYCKRAQVNSQVQHDSKIATFWTTSYSKTAVQTQIITVSMWWHALSTVTMIVWAHQLYSCHNTASVC